MSKPSEFYVGVLDFFAILLPGAIAAAILAPKIGHYVLGPLIAVPASDAAAWATFLTFSYFLGHLIFLIGSYIDRLYDVVRKRLNPYDNQSAYQCATLIRVGRQQARIVDSDKVIARFQPTNIQHHEQTIGIVSQAGDADSRRACKATSTSAAWASPSLTW